MRQVLHGLAIGCLALSAAPAAAQQQGSIQISAAAQGVTGDPVRTEGQEHVEPDAGVLWLQPGSRFGMFHIEVHGVMRGGLPHFGRTYLAARDVKYRGATWTLEAGDTYFNPSIGDYKFSNLATSSVSFSGGAVSARTPRSSFSVTAGRTTAWRNMFGSDPDTLGQTLAMLRASHRPWSRLELSARAARVRTKNLKEFTYTIAAGDEAGLGVRYKPVSSIQFVVDATAVSYRRAGSSERVHDMSLLAGGSWLLSRGWFQVNAYRFSPGEFAVLHYPLQDREGIFGAGEYGLVRWLRLFGGVDAFRSNLDLNASSASARPQPQSEGLREFGGMRVQLGGRTALTLRKEEGDRVSRPTLNGAESESDTGSFAAEYQAIFGRVTSFTRYSRRENVDRTNQIGSYTQEDSSAQFFVTLSRATQVFGVATVTKTRGVFSGNTYWQAGGGAQIQIPHRSLWVRSEGTVSRNVDLLTQSYVPRESLSMGLNGQLSSQLAIALNVNVDRSPLQFMPGNPWMTRSTLRLTHTIPTGSARASSRTGTTLAARVRGTGSIVGNVFADWNANGLADPGEGPLEGIPLQVASVMTVNTAHDGQFSFLNVPAGLQRVGLDMTALPVDFDPPGQPEVQVELSRGATRRLSFGLIPLGAVSGRVLHDVNGNGAIDPADEPVDGAVLILDGGARSEQARKGRFRFDAVRSGDHVLKLLEESMPEGTSITGAAEVPVSLTREHLAADVTFLVRIEKRPEVRKVFPQKVGAIQTTGRGSQPAARRPESPARSSQPAARRPEAPGPPAEPTPPREVAPTRPRSAAPPAATRAASGEQRSAAAMYSIQVAALNDPLRAKSIVAELKRAGFPAFLVEPPPSDPDGPYRIRVGQYDTRAAAQRVVDTLEKRRGEKLWVIRGH